MNRYPWNRTQIQQVLPEAELALGGILCLPLITVRPTRVGVSYTKSVDVTHHHVTIHKPRVVSIITIEVDIKPHLITK
jgi:hypothetical protein